MHIAKRDIENTLPTRTLMAFVMVLLAFLSPIVPFMFGLVTTKSSAGAVICRNFLLISPIQMIFDSIVSQAKGGSFDFSLLYIIALTIAPIIIFVTFLLFTILAKDDVREISNLVIVGVCLAYAVWNAVLGGFLGYAFANKVVPAASGASGPDSTAHLDFIVPLFWLDLLFTLAMAAYYFLYPWVRARQDRKEAICENK